MNRSTCKLQLSPEGKAFYERSIKILEDIAKRNAVLARAKKYPDICVLASAFRWGDIFCFRCSPAFLSRYPDIILDLNPSDQLTNLLEERIDVANRSRPMPDSSLITRKPAETTMVTVASPAYLAQHGKPEDIEDLVKHNTIGFNFRRAIVT